MRGVPGGTRERGNEAMRNKLLSLAALGVALLGAAPVFAGLGIMPSQSTIHRMTENAGAVVKARILRVTESAVEGHNFDTTYYAYNNNNQAVRRDLVIEVTRVIRGENVTAGEMTIVSLQQRSLGQYPASLQAGAEGVFFLWQRDFDGRWEVFGEARGLLTRETTGTVEAAERSVDGLVMLKTEFEGSHYQPALQDQLLADLRSGNGRIATDAAIEFGWHSADYAAHFSESEKNELLQLLPGTERASALRQELVTAIGRIRPTGGEQMLVDMIATDGSVSVASLGSWALEQYGRAPSAGLLVDKYVTLPKADVVGRARVITALGIMRPRDNAEEGAQRTRFTDVLKQVLATPASDAVTEEALLAARDMRYTGDELGASLRKIISDYKSGASFDEVLYKRAIVALAATRNTAAREYLLTLKGEFGGKFDKHIELSMQAPFAVLVDGK